MKNFLLGLVMAGLLFSGIAFAAESDAQDKWVAFQQKQREEQMAFYKKQQEAKEEFLKNNPDIVAYMEKENAEAKERTQKMIEERRKAFEARKDELVPPPQPVPAQ